jgi:hypothetical protein
MAGAKFLSAKQGSTPLEVTLVNISIQTAMPLRARGLK